MVKQRGRKRKHAETKENVPPEEEPRIDRSLVDMKQTDWMPQAAVQYHAENDHIEARLQEVEEKLRFIGPFRKLRGEVDVSGIDLIMLDRDRADLPEMQAFMSCTAGRYGFWRDTPDTKDIYVVFGKPNRVPTVIGNTVDHAVLHFLNSVEAYLPAYSNWQKKAEIVGTTAEDLKAVDKVRRDLCAQRKANCVAGTRGNGLILIDSGENPLTYHDIPNAMDMTHVVRAHRLVGIPEERKRAEKLIDIAINDVQMCNDEGNYANGLELGYVLYCGNERALDDFMFKALITAYKLTNRRDYTEILYLTEELTRFPIKKTEK